ncbi:MAG: hypothetical protein DMF63_14790 [Acidobacteria bacterium]|nr:MAG: hypothetical protein DMF63_14790 [Acidobacteriota bacterium]
MGVTLSGFIVFVIALTAIVLTIVRSRNGFGDYFQRSKYHPSSLVSVLLSLPDEKADELLELYKNEFGKGPARYARKTLDKWRSGRVQPASQTYRRFLVHLPKVMSYDMKCEVLRHFMQEFATKSEYQLDVYPDDWEEKLSPLIAQIIDKAYTAQLPAGVEKNLKWLGEGDMLAAQKILRSSQVEESRIMVSDLRSEFENLERILDHDNLKPRVTHVLKFPYGTIKLNVKRR